MTERLCNICGHTRMTMRASREIICDGCGSHGRTRLLWLMLTRHDLLRPGQRCLHIAPEAAIAPRLHAVFGDGYEPVDAAPGLFPFAPGIRHFDLVTETATLPSGVYDLILHSHVLEHVRGNVTAILFHLHRALKPGGKQVCCIPVIRERHYAEDLGPLGPDEAVRRFGQDDHVRLFGAKDVQATLGMIFALPERYELLGAYDAELLARHGIPEIAWSGWSANSVLMLGKQDLLLRD
jgi:phosphoglycolate phosphatase